MNKKPILAIVLPCYNEEEVLEDSFKKLSVLRDKLVENNQISEKSYFLFVDDGSKDNTWKIIDKFSNKFNYVKGIKLSRNVGHQNALFAGMKYVRDKADFIISMDVDLQDDINVIPLMIDKFLEGYEIVYGVRRERRSDTFFKRFSAEMFYKILNKLGVDIIFNHADFRLLSQRACWFLTSFPERNLFLRGLVRLVGLKNTKVFYERKGREKGESKYPLKKMLSLAINGITSFSTIPLKIISIMGFLVFMISIIMSLYVLYIAIFTSKSVPGWASTLLSMYFLGGIIIFSIGILGEYIAKIYEEVKRRPRFFIEEILYDKK